MKENHINLSAENQSGISKIYELEKKNAVLEGHRNWKKILVYPQMTDPKKARELIKVF